MGIFMCVCVICTCVYARVRESRIGVRGYLFWEMRSKEEGETKDFVFVIDMLKIIR